MLYFLIKEYPIILQSLIVLTASLFFSIVITPVLVSYLRKKKLGQTVRELGPESHFHKSGTPNMGGVAFVLSPVISCLIFLPLNNLTLWIVLFSFISLALLGFVDDYLKLIKNDHYGVSPKQKILYQIFITFFIGVGVYYVVGSNIYLPLVYRPVLDLKFLIIPFAMLVVISWSNAVNLTDGLDGLAGGLSVLAAIPLIVMGFIESSTQIKIFLPSFVDGSFISIFLLSVVGSLLVFLWFNCAPAQIFMGDTGSLSIGGLFATCSLLLKIEFLFAYIGLLFILENLSVIIQVYYYKKTKKRVFRMAPLHHHFEQKGIPETKIVIRAWIIQIVLAVSSLLILFYKKS